MKEEVKVNVKLKGEGLPSTLDARPSMRGPKHSNSGVALVVVLGMLVLVLVLVVAFLSSVSVELQSAKKYSSGADARSLADSAVSLVISQIQDATSSPRLAWASQPGMIRTFDSEGAPVMAYKLYSSATLRNNGGFNAVANQNLEVPSNWASNPALFADLNKPVAVSGTNRYPIIDPSAVAANVSGGAALSGTSAIEGCFINTSNPAVAVSAGQTNPVPMPVQWMYVLNSGSLAAMDPSTNIVAGASNADPIVGRIAFWTDDETSKVNINTASEGTFWDRPWAMGVGSGGMTGSYPNKTSPSYEERLALNMPGSNEFQRYPGHPAMTSLSPIFPRKLNESPEAYNQRIYGIIPRINDKSSTNTPTGSQSGTKNVIKTTAPILPDNDRLFASVDEFFFSATSAPSRQVNLSGPSENFTEDELEKARFFITANSRAPEVNLFNKPRITLWPLQVDPDPVANISTRTSKDKLIAFCSEVGGKEYYFQRYNTYTSQGQLPIPSSQSPLMDYYLQSNVSSPPNPPSRNEEILTYLQRLTEWDIPGLGGNFFSKYPNTRNQILTQMLDFVRSNVNTFSTGESPNYFFTIFNPSGFVTGQSQIVPLVLPGVVNAKGFGKFSTITEAALVFYREDKLSYKLLDASGNPTGALIEAPSTSTSIAGRVVVYDSPPPPDPPQPIHVGAVLVLEPFNPSPSSIPWSGHVKISITGLNGLTLNGSVSSTPFTSPAVNLVTSLDSTNNATSQTGLEQYFQYKGTGGKFAHPKTLGTASQEQNYPFFAHFTLPAGTSTMDFSGGTITIEIYPGSATVLDSTTLVQTITMTFPGLTGLSVPTVPYTNSYSSATGITTLSTDNWRTDYNRRISWLDNYKNQPIPPGHNGRFGIAEDWREPGLPSRTPHGPLPFIVSSGTRGDIVRSVEARYGGAARGDYRIFAGLKNVPATFFEGHGISDTAKGTPLTSRRLYTDLSSTSRLVHSLTIDGMSGSADQTNQNGYYAGAGAGSGIDPRGILVSGVAFSDTPRGDNTRRRKAPVVPRGLAEAVMADGTTPGDWDTGPGAQVDGPFINPADQASANTSMISTSLYYNTGGYITGSGVAESGSSFSPNRQISSAVAFGSLPTGIDQANPAASRPWQTLLFGKHPAGGDSHPGFGVPLTGPPYSTPPDHAFLDLFTMPIVEPYAISEPFSTAGKVNMNYQIVPFTYLTRSTGVRAVMKSTNIMAIPASDGLTFKLTNTNPDYRYTLNLDELAGTLAGFERRFNSGDIFRSASEICDISLVPKYRVGTTTEASGNPTYSTMGTWWSNYKLTGDNVREGPYGFLYPRLTTKSNTFTVHVMAQSISKANGTSPNRFVEDKDQISGEFRGSFLIERYLDPNADSLVLADGKTPGTETDLDSMVGPYKFRVINTKRFAP